ncbi:MAG TPA: hypothetical protein VJH03_23885 [Blastocatellia bacterium]|nr:hypothetical protein [Blastocatellia bacterium]
MKGTGEKRVELFANIAIIALAVIAGFVLIRNHLLERTLPPQAARRPDPPVIPPAGTKIFLPGVSWDQSERTLLLVLSTDCRFCAESADFYRRLAQETAASPSTRLMAVFSQDTEGARKYLSKLDVPVNDVKQSPLSSVGVRGTPSLLLVDNSGAVTESWFGRLSAAKETEVLNRLKCESCE